MHVKTEHAISKVPALTLGFWTVKIAATTLGETGGDWVTMSLDLGYLVGSLIFLAAFVVLVAAQIRASRFKAWLYWATIIATTTFGTTLADFCDRSLGLGYAGGVSIIVALLAASLATWYRVEGTVSVDSVTGARAEWFYWATIMFSQTLGTALGDFVAGHDLGGLGARLRDRRGDLRREPGAGCGTDAVGARVAHRAVLGGLRADAPARRHARRLARQAGGARRPGTEPLLRHHAYAS